MMLLQLQVKVEEGTFLDFNLYVITETTTTTTGGVTLTVPLLKSSSNALL